MPGFANSLGIDAVVTVHCVLMEDGHPFHCQAIDETVHGLGFAAAARLVVASGELRARRLDGAPTPGQVVTRVRFHAPPLATRGESWQGQEAGEEGLRLAGQVLDKYPEPRAFADQSMDGLDFDRRAVVGPWVVELMTPSPERLRQIQTIQLARLFTVSELQGALDGRFPAFPNGQDFMDAAPGMTASELANLEELRRRYCERYECGEGASEPVTP
ncbi:MAG: hypothetical protein EON96_11330 [Caulobacteraceae bacterium]|nr:MAG: hypothetical protein EON96_11330 [Caulobacteraceae bacterium]